MTQTGATPFVGVPNIAASRPSRPTSLFLVAAVLSPVAAVSANPALTVAAVWTLAVVVSVLLRFGEPPVLAFAITMQWAAVALPIFTANADGFPLGVAYDMPTMVDAAWLGLIAIFSLAVGMYFGRGRQAVVDLPSLRQVGAALSPKRLLLAYGVALVTVQIVLPTLMGAVPGLRQPLLALAALPMLVAFLILWSAAVSVRARALAVAVVGVNIVIGFGGFFADFKTLILLALIVLAAKATSLREVFGRPVVWLLTGLLVIFASFWSVVKVDYRTLLSAGTGAQVVLVRPAARASFLAERARRFGVTDFKLGIRLTLSRYSYLDYFAGSINTVPNNRPHTQGQLWSETFTHVLLPRVLYPGKKSIDDSDRTNLYSGYRVAGAAEGASVSIGYVGESYIDFGPVVMFVPITLLGFFWGAGFRVLATAGPVPLVNVATATVFILPAATLFESSNIKLVGGAVTSMLALYPFLRYASGPLWSILTARPRSRVDLQ